jgi:imidazoleglycerol phosphate dehydratase HisB
MSARTANVNRQTSETSIEVFLDLDWEPSSSAKQEIDISTGIGFLDHVRLPFTAASTHLFSIHTQLSWYEK